MADSANYTTQSDAYSRRVQWLVEIDIDTCTNRYTDNTGGSTCTAVDAGDGSRCHYSFPTCQDQVNFVKGTRTLRFCLSEVPWADPAVSVHPYLSAFVDISQKIDPKKLFSYPEKIRLRMAKDFDPMPLDLSKPLHNTALNGEFWSNLIARNKNYPGRAVRVLRGFSPVGGAVFLLADFSQVGPDYKLTEVRFGKNQVTLIAESEMSELNKKKIPFTISEDNTVQTTITSDQTTVDVLDAREYPDPDDFTLNKVYVKIETEICEVTSIDFGNDELTIVRAAFGTSQGAHDAGQKVTHVCCFGTDPGGATTGDNVIDVIRQLLEWAGIPASRVAGTGFDRVKAMAWPRSNIKRILSKPKTVAKLLQPLRETRGIMIFINADGNWSAAVFAPNETTTLIDDDDLVFDSVSTIETEEDRLTRIEFWYDPVDTDKAGEDPKDFNKGVIVIDTDLEGANSFNDVKAKVIVDPWTDTDAAVGDVKLIARRMITRLRHGVRVFKFALDLKNNNVDVGNQITLTSRLVLDRDGNPDPRPVVVTSRKQRGLGKSEYEGVDVNFGGRFMRIGPDTIAETYDASSAADKEYGYWADTDNRVGAVFDNGYIFW